MSEEISGAAGKTTRRRFLAAGAGIAGSAAFAPAAAALTRNRAKALARPDLMTPKRTQREALDVLGRTGLRAPGSLPDPSLPAGTDTMPEIENVIVAMMENHSYDNLLGMLGRGPYETPRGSGFTLAADGYPNATNPQANGTPLRAFKMPTTCQLSGHPSQEWEASHQQFANGTNQGFIVSITNPTEKGVTNGPVTMGYWDGSQLPFLYDLAGTFPLGDRYFSSVLGQTLPNRRFLISGTSLGYTDNDSPSIATPPPNGSIFNRLHDAGISFMEYYEQYPSTTSATMALSLTDTPFFHTNQASMTQFFSDCAAGKLPAFSFLDPNFGTQSQENPQNIAVGEAWLAGVVKAVGAGPNWDKTVMIVNYDEHGGYYDHVVPPVALAPDDVPPIVLPGESSYDGFSRYGFRVPCVVVSPYAKSDYVSSVVYDHTSVLAFVERKWNLEAMTYRDANANDLSDFLDLDALRAKAPTFPEMPELAAAGNTPEALACSTTGPGTIPPARPAALPIDVRFTSVEPSTSAHALLVGVQASRPGLGPVRVRLLRDGTHISSDRISALTQEIWTVPMRERRALPKPGRYTLELTQGTTVLLRKSVTIR
jgi:phospholipase C